MKYSFVVIAYNEETAIESCIGSIVDQKGIGSSYEIIVVDDGSRDKTAEIVTKCSKKNSKVKLISYNVNCGRGYARNEGILESTGEFIAMVDADISLPTHWLEYCLKNITGYDAVGGVATPDGDVSYVHSLFKLSPKLTPHTTTVSGGNGLYRRDVFKETNFDQKLREGEDVDFNHQLEAKGLNSKTIPNLLVHHQETKSFVKSIKWLFESGIGATRQLIRYRRIRTPDIAYFGFVLVVLSSLIIAMLLKQWFMLSLIFVYPLITSLLHIRSRFYYSTSRKSGYLGAVVTNYFLIISYYLGRSVGWKTLV